MILVGKCAFLFVNFLFINLFTLYLITALLLVPPTDTALPPSSFSLSPLRRGVGAEYQWTLVHQVTARLGTSFPLKLGKAAHFEEMDLEAGNRFRDMHRPKLLGNSQEN